jgi:type IV secretory pathway VirB10-like protein
MQTRSVLTTAAAVLLASTVFAAAQGTQRQAPGGEGGPAPAQTQQHEGQQGKQAPQKGERRENGSQKGAQVQEREGSGKQQQGKQETQKEQRGEPKGKGERNDAAQRNERNDAAQRGERNDGQRGEQRTGDAGRKTLTVEQKTKVRETVLRGGNLPRVSSVNFNVSVGTVVPTTVRVVEVPPVLIEYYPDWRGYLYFVYNDEIIVVDHNHHIVAVLQV